MCLTRQSGVSMYVKSIDLKIIFWLMRCSEQSVGGWYCLSLELVSPICMSFGSERCYTVLLPAY